MKKAAESGKYVVEMHCANTTYLAWDGTKLMDKDVSRVNTEVAKAMPVYLFTLSEVEFLKAEVELRFNNDEAAAKADYEAAVENDFLSRQVAGYYNFIAGDKVNFDTQATKEDKLKLIYMQKWVALFYRNHFEAWSEQRRTDVPAVSSASAEKVHKDPTSYNTGNLIVPAVNYYGNNGLCKRMPYPSSARQWNKNTPAVKTLADPAVWDVK